MAQTDPQAATLDEARKEPPPSLPTDANRPPQDDLIEEDLLVEDVSIDGMCGVY